MTFLKFCEIANGKPFTEWQKDYILKMQKAIEEGKTINMVRGRGSTKFDRYLLMRCYYHIWKEEKDE